MRLGEKLRGKGGEKEDAEEGRRRRKGMRKDREDRGYGFCVTCKGKKWHSGLRAVLAALHFEMR